MKEQILEVLESEKNPLTLIEINDLLSLKTAEELADLSKEIDLLIEECIIYKTKKDKFILLKHLPSLKIGKLSINKKGFGFLILDKEDDIYIHQSNLNGAIHDDIVLVELTNYGMKKEGIVLKIIKREFKNLVGEIIYDKKGDIYLELDNEKLDVSIKIDKTSANNCVEGSKVLVQVVKEVTKKKYLAKVIKVLGHKNDPGVDIKSIAYKYGIYDEFPEEVENEITNIPTEVSEKELIGRTDLTNQIIFTIDGDDTKDIDDAISIEKNGDNYILGVHIADVSNYVKENTALGDEAYSRGTSSYLADTVIPMIPHKLSNGICSLNPNVLRLTMSCVMEISPSGKVIKYDIFESFIKSRIQMTYKKVNDIIVRNIVAPEYEEYKDKLYLMKELADILRKEKTTRGYIDFELDESKIIQDEKGICVDVIKRTREAGEMLIEDFMIAANETIASHISNMALPFLYRVHDVPREEKIVDFMNLVKVLGYRIDTKITDLKPSMMQNILGELKTKKEFPILSSLLLRSMAKAVYSKDNIGHFGLASRDYTHFTSPIRRFPDLTVHRLLKKYLVEKDFSMETIKNYETSLIQIGDHSSEREQAAINAERDVDDMKMAEYMESHIGEEFTGIIDTVTSFGFFVQLPNLIEGLVHVNSLKGDYFVYVPETLAMIGKNTKKTYRIGDEVKVICVHATKDAALIDFEIVGDKNVRNSE